jgi:hypothetical protein
MNEAGEMYAEKRKLGIGHRIDKATHQMLAIRSQLVILASEGHDLCWIANACLAA